MPTKAFLEQAVAPTVMKALSEVCKARPDNPLEFMAYYILKHNPNRVLDHEGAQAANRNMEDKQDGEEGEEAGDQLS